MRDDLLRGSCEDVGRLRQERATTQAMEAVLRQMSMRSGELPLTGAY